MLRRTLLLSAAVALLPFVASRAGAVDCGSLPPVDPVSLGNTLTFQYTTFGGSDCWGWEGPDGTEYAIMGVAEGVAFANVTTGQQVQIVPGPIDGCGSVRWRDMVTYDHYCYCVSECSGTNEGMMVMDMQYLPDSVHLIQSYVATGERTSHNMSVDTARGYAYAVRRIATGFRVIDLSNPEAPVDIGKVSTGSLHDIFARNDTVWAAEGSQGRFSIWDLSDKLNPQLLARFGPQSPGYAHNIWPSPDGQFVVTTEETPQKTIKVWDTRNLQNVTLIGEILGSSQLAHNVHVFQDYIVTSHYESGIQVVDVSEPSCPREAGLFDTYLPNNSPSFNGAWGAFPYTTSGKIYASNDDGRLFVLQSNLNGVSFSGSPQLGEAPFTVDFLDQTIGTVTSWLWNFGDGQTSSLQNPQHEYTLPGQHDVTLTVLKEGDLLSRIRTGYVTVLAETLVANDMSAEPTQSVVWDLSMENHFPISEIVLPFSFTNVTSVAFFDSVSFVGTRLGYFELKQVVQDNHFNGQLAIRCVADNGGGSPPLATGSGVIARAYLRVRNFAAPGDTVHFTFAQLGSWGLTATTTNGQFTPKVQDATLTVVPLTCLCPNHGDVVDDGVLNSSDLNRLIDIVFFNGAPAPKDSLCVHVDRGDYNCDGFDDSTDLNLLIGVIFFNGTGLCDPCACSPYPTNCP